MKYKNLRDIPRTKRKVVALRPNEDSLRDALPHLSELIGNGLLRGLMVIPVMKDGQVGQREVFGEVATEDILIAGVRMQGEFLNADAEEIEEPDE